MKQSNFLSLGWRDFLRGLAMAILTPVVTLITNSVDSGQFTFNWRLIVLSAIGGAGAYLLKNVFTKPDKIEDIVRNSKADGPGGSNPPADPNDK